MSENNQIKFDIEEPEREEQKKFIDSEANYRDDGNCGGCGCGCIAFLVCVIIISILPWAVFSI
tara:strand:+ start:81 stop:269 length:189 start_codon:yes stop_codon:yes gene_type:complete